jgi:cation diffusion facilitator CzcD-associated flavoprotein CzcO
MEPVQQVERCDLCVVGAGYAGLNALSAASQYLSPDQRVVLVDRRERVGGMWVDIYPYVRLHQPYRMFTAGGIRWDLDDVPSHLATKDEVLDHLQRCLDVIRRRVVVDEYFGCEYVSEHEGSGSVVVACRDRDGRSVVIEADRLIKAYGHDVHPKEPLDVSSAQVRSVSPDHDDLVGAAGHDAAPVWIVGGGKTGMDTAYTLLTHDPAREVNLLAGSGTWFLSRDRLFPTGRKRWWGGRLNGAMWLAVGRRFDGTNEAEVWDWFRSRYGVWVTPETGNSFFAYLSDAECETIRSGVTEVLMDHLVDVVDGDDGPRLTLRSGGTRAIPAGSWIVNCTGYLYTADPSDDPYVSEGGRVLTLQPRSPMGAFPDYMGYFLTHLLFLGRLSEVPLVELDLRALLSKSRQAAVVALMDSVLYNLSLVADTVPRSVMLGTRFDFERWYPRYRRMALMTRFLVSGRRDRVRWRRSLERVADRFDVRCGPLPHVTGVRAEAVSPG